MLPYDDSEPVILSVYMEQFITNTITKAGDEIMKYFGNVEISHSKATENDIVTQADLISEQVISEAIKQNYPDHGIISEESEGYQTDADHIWYIDPLDGTKNFASGVQLFGINIALSHKGEIICASIYLPALKELLYAEKGKGTFLNGTKVTCSKKDTWKNTYGLGPIRYSEPYVNVMKLVDEISEKTGWINSIASPAVCAAWIASGKRDWYIGPSKNSWDYAAPCLIAKEAGCVVTNFTGAEWRPGDKGIIFANEHLHPKLLEIVKASYDI